MWPSTYRSFNIQLTSSDYSKLSLFVYILKLVWFLVLLMLYYCVLLLYTNYYSLPSNIFYLFEFSAQYFIVVEHSVVLV